MCAQKKRQAPKDAGGRTAGSVQRGSGGAACPGTAGARGVQLERRKIAARRCKRKLSGHAQAGSGSGRAGSLTQSDQSHQKLLGGFPMTLPAGFARAIVADRRRNEAPQVGLAAAG